MNSKAIKLFSTILISCVGLIVYSDSFWCSFHYDDFYFIVHNPAIWDLHNLQGIWHYYHGRFLVFLSLALNYHLNGFNVFGYHVVNWAVHLVTAFLVWWLVILTLSTPVMKDKEISPHAHILALCAGLVFVSHPLAVEAVTNIWQRAASMAAMFYLASVCLYTKYRLRCPSQIGYYITALMAALAAMFCKQNSITLPLMIVFYEITFLKPLTNLDVSSLKSFIVNRKYLIPFFLTLLIIPITCIFNKNQVFQDMHGNLRQTGQTITPMHYFLTEFRVIVTYIRMLFLPLNQNFDYDYPIYKSFLAMPVFVSFIFLISVLYGVIRQYSKYPMIAFFIFWFFITLMVPESSFWVLSDVILEHRLYLPLAGFSIFLVCAVYCLWGNKNLKLMVIVLSMIITCNSVLTYQRNKVWKNEFTLWDDAVHQSPHKARPYINRGAYWANQGDFIKAMSDFSKAIALNPGSPEAYYNLGNAYRDQRKLMEAVFYYSKAIEINPNNAEVFNNRGFVYFKEGRRSEALSDFNKAIDIDPSNVEAYNNRGLTYAVQGQFKQALADFNKVLTLDPKNEKAYKNRIITLKNLRIK